MKKQCPKVAIAAIPILCINFFLNLPRLQFEQLTVSKIVTDTIVLIHPVLIGIILYRFWKWKNTEQD
ncbi:hypothetical protein [Streptococcus marmotae]|uniref:hypothetical protein n=1 Tax=Streptococcus marmotae TaxID=1825069 RepID=UPI00083328E5|nr:hypothetical protein [Streptococcus marmotae]